MNIISMGVWISEVSEVFGLARIDTMCVNRVNNICNKENEVKYDM